MIMIKKKIIILSQILFLVSSCETFQELTGLSKPEMDDSIITETPELVLPPDFNTPPQQQKVRREIVPEQKNVMIEQYSYGNRMPTTNPQITNYIAPKINMPSSSTPSDSLEKFKENKRFTIGEWVYGQYVDSFRRGNLYYRPIYDKGYNFSRRYVPEQNVFSFQPYEKPIEQTNSYSSPGQDLGQPIQNEYNTLDQLPIIE
ncbi:MAG: hypothetical protein CMM95_00500 [Rickettsiales bacterium]|nr:hypothetical protein [Rickettsiales bacterium]